MLFVLYKFVGIEIWLVGKMGEFLASPNFPGTLAVQRKMDLTFPAHLVKNIARLEIEKEIIDIEETSGALKKTLKR